MGTTFASRFVRVVGCDVVVETIPDPAASSDWSQNAEWRRERGRQVMKTITEVEGPVSRSLLDRLSRQEGKETPLLSLYLPADGSANGLTGGQLEKNTRRQFEQWRVLVETLDHPPAVRKKVTKALERAEAEVVERLGRRWVSGIAVFADPESLDLWIVPVGWGFPTMMFVESRFVLFPLELLLAQWDRFALCLTDKDEARLFVYSQHRMEEVTSIVDEIPGKVRFPDPFRELQYRRKHVVYFHRHFARVAEALLRLYQRELFDGLVIGCPRELEPQFRSHLHQYVADRVVATWEMPVDTPTSEILNRMVEFETQRLRERASKLRQRIDDAPPERKALGVDAVLKAAWEGRLGDVWMPPAFAHAGSACEQCARLVYPPVEQCPECGSSTRGVDDIGFELVQTAVAQGARVHFHDLGEAIDPPMAALLRF